METIIMPVANVIENTIVNRPGGRQVLDVLKARLNEASSSGRTEIKFNYWVGVIYTYNRWGNEDCDSLGFIVERYLDVLGFTVEHCGDALVVRWN